MFDQNQGFIGGNNGYGMGMMGGMPMGGNMYYNPTGNQMPQKIKNVLSDEEIKELQQSTNVFNLGLTEKESKQSICNHRSLDGTRDSLTYDSDTGLARCTICGYEFTPIEPNTSYDDIKRACQNINNILQTTKLLWPDMAAGAAREFYQIIALINKVPDLFGFAAKNFNRNEFNLWDKQNTPGGMAMLQNLYNILGANQATYFGGQPNMMGNNYGGYQGTYMNQPPMGNAPMMGQPMTPPQGNFMNQPVANPAVPNPAMNMGQPSMGNPFGYPGASQAPNPGYAYTPAQSTTPVPPTVTAPAAPTPSAPDAKETTTVTQQVTV